VCEAVARESANLDGDDTEGYPFEPIATHFASPMPVSPIPDGCLGGPLQTAVPPPLLLDSTQLPPPSPSPTSTSLSQVSNPQPRKQPKYTKGSKEDIRRKGRANAKRAVARLATKRAALYGDYMVMPRIINKHVRPATAVDAAFDAMKLRRTKSAYTGGRLKSGAKRIYRLDELIGDGSTFKFRLETWDGR
jgi:hypothetical protein